MISKIADRHLSREACIYIRQSTMGQVRFNQESTERQYNLASKASLSAGARSGSGSSTGSRPVGCANSQSRGLQDPGQRRGHEPSRAIFSLEASRLARSTRTGIACSSCAPSPARS